jgi:hypothetical protein
MRITSKHGQQYQCVLPIVHFETKESSTINVTTEEINKLLQPLNNTCLFQVRIQNSLWIKVAVVILCALTSNGSNTRKEDVTRISKSLSAWNVSTRPRVRRFFGKPRKNDVFWKPKYSMLFLEKNLKKIGGETGKNRRKIRILLKSNHT